MKYRWVKENHLFKDDYLYISYHGPLKEVIGRWGFTDIEDCENKDIFELWKEKGYKSEN